MVGQDPKITSRAKLTLVAPNTLPWEAVAQTYSCHSELRQEQQLEDHAALLKDEVFNVVPGMINMQHGTASRRKKVKSGRKLSEDEVFRLPQVPDTPIAGSGHGHKVTFRSPVWDPGQYHLHPVWSLSQCPSMCQEFLTLKHQGRTQIMKQRWGQGLQTIKPREWGIMLPSHHTAYSSWLKNLERSLNPKSRNLGVDIQPMSCQFSTHGLNI